MGNLWSSWKWRNFCIRLFEEGSGVCREVVKSFVRGAVPSCFAELCLVSRGTEILLALIARCKMTVKIIIITRSSNPIFDGCLR